jgi:hypothetical protein
VCWVVDGEAGTYVRFGAMYSLYMLFVYCKKVALTTTSAALLASAVAGSMGRARASGRTLARASSEGSDSRRN